MKLLSITLLAIALAPQAADPTVPPPTAKLRISVDARGVQVYRCAAQANAFQWVFQEPEATLFDTATKEAVGQHAAGPSWTWKDGSAITGKVVQKQASPDPAAIPWLLIETHAVGDKTGALTAITFVRRSETQAGAAPATGCDAQHLDNVIRVPYEATYTFYSTN